MRRFSESIPGKVAHSYPQGVVSQSNMVKDTSDTDIAEVLAAAAKLRRIRGTADPADTALAAALAVLADEVARTGEALTSRITTPVATLGVESSVAIRPTVLLVDDDDIALDAMNHLLAREFTVLATTDPFEALQLASRPVDAVITDLHMPGLDGLGLLRLLRAHPATAGLPCLLLTGDGAVGEKRAAFDHGAADYLTKPIDIVELIARLHARIEEARRLATQRKLQETDELTGLPNRRALRRVLTQAQEDCRMRGVPLTVISLDADGLKTINDTWGHAIGDRAICAVADALRSCLRDYDTAARLGGDEFAVVMPSSDIGGAERLMKRISDTLLNSPIDVTPIGTAITPPGASTASEQTTVVRVSHGAATLQEGETLDALLERADSALYELKRLRPSRR